MSALRILRPGLFTTVQDGGRWGHQADGVPISGAMDVYAHRLANRLVGNARDAATLEVTLVGPHVEFQHASVFAVTGAHFRMTLNDAAVAMNEAIRAPAASRLQFGERIKGARAYLAVAGGIDVPPVLGSRSTHVLSGMGGYLGRALKAGDELPVAQGVWRPPSSELPRTASELPVPEGGSTLRVVAGAFFQHIKDSRFTISTRSDRMGYRLEGSAVGHPGPLPPGGLISAAVPTGAVQVPPIGGPILLMADHATSGGYGIAGTVITADLALAAQLAPGAWIEFKECSLTDADEALRACEARLPEDPR